ncbi:GNAT family N-acetyltransferase [Edwardsiella tarda]|uniref:GNAT family N-acetyltransferase n=1 Tax=Edwardsiella tarda TaxID=636 RepID=UPI00063BF29E|nr:GNAT family N-acetyltransferase [Edwardsiella tarda]AKH89562.1 GNAT family N-acetyltransferase [Edwardsiella tarda]
MKIEDLYTGIDEKTIDIADGYSIHLYKQRGIYKSYPRMLEYSVYELDSIFNNTNILEGNVFFKELISFKYDMEFYCFQESNLFSFFPEYFENENAKVLKIDFVTNIMEVDYSKNKTFSDYLSGLSRKRRYKFNKSINDDSVLLCLCSSDEDFLAFKKMHIKQWGDNGDPSILNNSYWSDFYFKGFKSDIFCLHKIIDRKENAVIAYHLGFVKSNIFHYLMPTYDSSSRYDSPGFILLSKLIHHYSSDSSIYKFSLGSGDYSYKRWICNNSRALFKLSITKNKFKYNKNQFLRHVKSVCKRLLKTKLGV